MEPASCCFISILLVLSAWISSMWKGRNKTVSPPQGISQDMSLVNARALRDRVKLERDLIDRGHAKVVGYADELNQKRDAFEGKYREFAVSTDFKRIEQFSRRYAQSWTTQELGFIKRLITLGRSQNSEGVSETGPRHYGQEGLQQIDKLKELLGKKGWNFSREEIVTMIENSLRYSRVQDGKRKLLMPGMQNKELLFERFLEVSSSSDEEMLTALTIAINERPAKQNTLQPKTTFDEVKARVLVMERERELRLFEKGLAGDGYENYEPGALLSEIDSMTGVEFEAFLEQLFSRMGYQVNRTKTSGDQGADLLITKFGERVAVQAKRSGGPVGNKAVQEVVGSLALYRAQKAMVVTNSGFTNSATSLATSNRVELVGRAELMSLIERYW